VTGVNREMDWKKLLGSVTDSVDQELRLRNEYLLVENRILRQQVRGRLLLTDGDRKELAAIGQKLGRKALEEIATVAKGDTILAWNRKFAHQTCDSAKTRTAVGRPRIDPAIEALVIRMARENRSWGYDRIVGALKNLGYTISDQTVGNILKRHRIPPAPERKTTMTWQEFIGIHMDVLRATDFFTREVWTWLGWMISSILVFLHVGRRTISVAGMIAWRKTRSADWYICIEGGIRWVMEQGLSRLLLWGDCIRQPVLTECETLMHQAHVLQGGGKVVRLPVIHHRQIRDGPRRRRPQLGGLLRDNIREAA